MQEHTDLANPIVGAIAGALRLDASRTITVRPLQKTALTISHIRCDHPDHGMTAPFVRDNAYLITIQLGHYCSKQLWLGTRPLPPSACPEGSFLVLNLELEPTAYLHSPFDAVQLYLPQTILDEIADDCAANRIGPLSCPPGISLTDPVVRHLSVCLLPALEQPAQVNRLFLDYITLALSTHLACAYGGMRDASRLHQGRLAPWQERLAKDLIQSHLSEDLPLARIASECGLSLSHFSRAFKRSTGLPPHRWLLERRLDHAKDLMLSSTLSLAAIALACGFADQSHLSRLFARKVGMPPRAWRHNRKR
jgi:AraC-like DNA-binding protein